MVRKLPKGWARVALGDVCEVNPRADALKGVDKISFVAMADTSESGRLMTQTVVPITKKAVAGYTRFRRGDILCAKITPCFENGKGALTDNLEMPQGIGSTEFHVIRTGDRILPEIAHAVVQSTQFRRRGELWMTGSAGQKRVPADYIAEFEMELPPLDEQHRIVCVLDAADRQVALDEQLLTQREARYQSLLQTVLRPVEQQRAKGWRRAHLGDIFGERDERSGDLPLLAITGGHGVVPRDELERRDTSAEDKSNYKVIRKGDIGYNTMRMWQGVFGLSAHDGIVSPAYTVVMPDRMRILGEFAAHLFSHPRVVHTFHRYSQGLVDDTLQLKYPHFSEIRLPIPEISEQRRIAKALDAQLREVEQLRRLVELRRQQHRGLMQQLLTGQQRLTRDLPGMESGDV